VSRGRSGKVLESAAQEELDSFHQGGLTLQVGAQGFVRQGQEPETGQRKLRRTICFGDGRSKALKGLGELGDILARTLTQEEQIIKGTGIAVGGKIQDIKNCHELSNGRERLGQGRKGLVHGIASSARQETGAGSQKAPHGGLIRELVVMLHVVETNGNFKVIALHGTGRQWGLVAREDWFGELFAEGGGVKHRLMGIRG